MIFSKAGNDRVFLVIILSLFVLILSSFFWGPIEDDDDFFTLDRHIITSDDEISDEDPFPNIKTTKSPEESLEENVVDLERDLKLSELESLLITLLGLFAIIIISALLLAIKKASDLIFILGIVAIILVAVFVVFNIFITRSMLGEIYGRSDFLWTDIILSDFNAENIDDVAFSFKREMTSDDLSNDIIFSEKIIPRIEGIIHYLWNDERAKREAILLEFTSREDAENFVSSTFIEENNVALGKGSYKTGIFRTNHENYRKGYLMNDNKFVFLVFSEEPYSENLLYHLMNYYPEQYMIKDSRPPEIEVVSPLVTNINEIIFKVHDKDSGINQLYISLPNTEFNSIEDCRRNNNVKIDEFICAFRDLKPGRNQVVIVASDRERNNARKLVEYYFDTEEPSINILDVSAGRIRVRIRDNYLIEKNGITLIIKERVISTNNYCKEMASEIICEFLLQSSSLVISATDKAGNTNYKHIEVDIDEPIIEFTNPRNKFTKNSNLEFFVVDEGSGIKSISTSINDITVDICSRVTHERYRCRYNLNEVNNNVNVIAEDNSGNILNFHKNLVYDSQEPVLIVIGKRNNLFEFTIRDEISGINEEWIVVNGENFFVTDICDKMSNHYRCEYPLDYGTDLINIRFSDIAGNIKVFSEMIS